MKLIIENRITKLFVDSYSGLSKEVWLLALVTFINRAGAMVLPFLSLYLTKVEGYALSTTGKILLFYGIGSFLGNYLGGVLTDRIGAFRIQFLSLITTGFSFWLLSSFHSPESMAFGLFMTSLLADTFRPANMASVGVLTPEDKRTKAVGVLRLAINIGFSAGPASGGLIAYVIGYEMLFAIDGITCVLAALFLLYFFRNQIIAEGKKKSIDKDQEKPSILLVFKDKAFLFMVLLVFFIGFIFMQLFNTIPVYFKENLLLNEDNIGLLMAFNGVLVVLLELPIIHLYNNRNKSKLIALGTILLGLSYVILLYEKWAGVAVICLILFTVGEILTLPFITSAIINRASESLRGRYLALYGMAFSVTHIITPIVSLQIAESYEFSTLWIIVGVASIFTAIGFWRLRLAFK